MPPALRPLLLLLLLGTVVACANPLAPAPPPTAPAPTAPPATIVPTLTAVSTTITPPPSTLPTPSPGPAATPRQEPPPTLPPTATARPESLSPPARPSPPPPVAPTVSAELPATPVTARQLADITRALAAVTSFRVQGTIMVAEVGQLEIVIEQAAADRFRRRIKSSTLAIEIITLGDRTYYNAGQGWRQTETDSALEQGIDDELDPTVLFRSVTSASLTTSASETIDGILCDVFTYQQADDQGRLWVGRHDHLPRKVEGISQAGAYSLTLTDFNQPIEILAPTGDRG